MQLSPPSVTVIVAILLLTRIEDSSAKRKTYQCPLGFLLAFTDGGAPICYRQKEQEAFADKFKGCVGNLYSSKLYHSLNFTKTKQVLWTEYKSLYPGGPFIDWSYTGSTGEILLSTYDVKYDSSLGIDEELCVLIDPVSNFTAARCDEKHYRYCFVKPYPEEDDRSTKGCRPGFQRYYSPVSTCLTAVTGVGGGTVRATWRQAQDLCAKRGASLLHSGWRYSNDALLHLSGALPFYPFGIKTNSDHSTVQYDTSEDTSEIAAVDWNFDTLARADPEAVYGAIRNDNWRLVNSSFLFLDVICEQSVPPRNIDLQLTVDWENKIILEANDTISKSDILCFTDSRIYYPKEVSTRKASSEGDNIFHVIPASNGYYWCVQVDQKNYLTSESNKALYIRSKDSVLNLYAVKIRLKNEYRLQNLDKLNDLWKKKLEEYIYYSTKYISIYGELPVNGTEETLKAFQRERLHLDWRDGDVIYNLKLRRLYLDARTALVHVMLNPVMMPAALGAWDMIEVLFMRPAYYCRGFDSVPSKELGESVTTAGCQTYTCVGDFNEGVQWVKTETPGCTLQSSVLFANVNVVDNVVMPTVSPTFSTKTSEKGLPPTSENESSSSEEKRPEVTTEPTELSTAYPLVETTFSTVVTTQPPIETTLPTASSTTPWIETTVIDLDILPPTPVPTTTVAPIPPEEQLQQVVGDLEQLLCAESLTIESISQPFDQVNDILDVEDTDLEIPGQLLHLLDQLASRVELTAGQAMEVRNNVAILMADATPERPIRGVRVAARDYDGFSNSSFGFIDSEIESDQLLRNSSEAVVYLPESVSAQPRRISFVAFRNQRAFRSDLPVNSRIFSVNVENLTHFEDGEVIDIHLSPLVEDPDRNQSRACAYWQFTDDGGGYWSQEGCTLISATTPGAMDTCRCTHLTHFAEVLVPRTVFSEENERALEILSIIGCCLSLFGLAMIGLTAALFRTWRRDYSNKIWLQLCIAIFILVLCFLVVAFTNFNQYNVPCMLVGVALHYSVEASFCWMLVAAILSYRRLVLVFTRDMSHKLLRASAFAWGTPCAIVGILLSVDPQSYQGRFDETAPTGAFCYPSGLSLWLAVYMPIAIMLLANWILFILIVRSVFASRRIQRHGDSNEALRCASVSCLLVFLFGLPWIFGLFAYNVVLAYLFTLTGTFQGFVLFIFFVLGNKKTRDLWLNKLKIKQTRKVPVTSSTFTNRSTAPGSRAGMEGTASIEAKTSKPRSLTSPDDSRFS